MTSKVSTTSKVSKAELGRLVSGEHHNPHGILGAHPQGDGKTVIRTLRPLATSVTVIMGEVRAPLKLVHDGGVFEATVASAITDYRLEISYGGDPFLMDDPYRWLPTLGDVDLQLIGEGRHANL